MITFFRSFFQSKIGLFLTMAFVALIAVAFAGADVTGGGSTFGGVSGGEEVISIGDEGITSVELQQQTNDLFGQERRNNPDLLLTDFIDQGGYELVIEQLTNTYLIAQFGEKYGMGVSDRLIDSEIRNLPAFRGANGQFDEEIYRRALSEAGRSEQQLRDDLRRSLIAEQILTPVGFGVGAPGTLITPYADLQLETRIGRIALIPSRSFFGDDEISDDTLQNYVNDNSARYRLPEQRVIRYALFDDSRFRRTVTVAEEDIRAEYEDRRDEFAASENRIIRQVITPTEEAANAVLAQIADGQSLTEAAASIGLEATDLGDLNKGELAAQTSNAVADAAFAAEPRSMAAAAQSQLGWHVVRVGRARRTEARSFADARTELEGELTARATREALTEYVENVDDRVSRGASLDDVAEADDLEILSTPALLSNGQSVSGEPFAPNPIVTAILPTAFALTANSDPALQEVLPGRQFAIVDVGEIIPAAPPALEIIRPRVELDYRKEQGATEAQERAQAMIAAIEEGEDMDDLVDATDYTVPPIERINTPRTALLQARNAVPPPVALLFSMASDSVKLLEAPNQEGWFVVRLDEIERGDSSESPELVAGMQEQLRSFIGREYTEQFIRAMANDIGVERDEDAIRDLGEQLAGRGNAQQ